MKYYFINTINMGRNSSSRKNIAAVILKTGRADSAVIISSVTKASRPLHLLPVLY